MKARSVIAVVALVFMALLLPITWVIATGRAEARAREAEDTLLNHFNAERWSGRVPGDLRDKRVELFCTGPTGQTVMVAADLDGASHMEVVLQFDPGGMRGSLALSTDNGTLYHRSATPIPLALSGRQMERQWSWANGATLMTTYDGGAAPPSSNPTQAAPQTVRVRFVPDLVP